MLEIFAKTIERLLMTLTSFYNVFPENFKSSRKFVDFCLVLTYKEFVREDSLKSVEGMSYISKQKILDCLKNNILQLLYFSVLKSNIKVVKHYKIGATNKQNILFLQVYIWRKNSGSWPHERTVL